MIELFVDSITLRGPRVDGGYVISLNVGEYMASQVAELVRLPQGVMTKVVVDIGEPNTRATDAEGLNRAQ